MIFFIDMRRFFMMILFLALSFSIFAIDVDAEKETKILFIGNSYTFCNDLPSMIKEISITAGKKISVDSYSIAGSTFRNPCAGQMEYISRCYLLMKVWIVCSMRGIC